MRVTKARQLVGVNVLALAVCACSSESNDATTTAPNSGVTGQPASTNTSTSAGTSTAQPGTSAGTATGLGTTGTPQSGATSATTGAGMQGTTNAASTTGDSDGASTTTTTSAGGASSTAGATTGASGDGCSIGPWPSADPQMAGPYDTVTEEDVGPLAGEDDDGNPVQFTMFRPAELGEAGLCHPIITWGNGTGSTPDLYGVLLRHLASHGFIVIASNSPQVSRGDPPPMVAGVSWVIEQNDDPTSELYQHVDVTHVGATGHSQGGFATTQAGGDSQITTIAPLCGAGGQRNLHGPALLLCGGMDDIATCSGIENTFDGINEQPVMLANYLTADHADWITFFGSDISPMETAVVAWMRVQLMGDTELRPWFYGASCGLCTDSAWAINQKLMDE